MWGLRRSILLTSLALVAGVAACTASPSPSRPASPAPSGPAATAVAPASPTSAVPASPTSPPEQPTGTPSPVSVTPTTASRPAVGAPSGAPQPSRNSDGEPIKIGQLCDRSGITVNIGSKLCDAYQNWIEMVNNTQGGVKGRRVDALEIDHKYEVPIAVDAYKKLVTRDKVPQILSYGTPITDALVASAQQDEVLLWTPGFGLSPASDGRRFPYVFVGVATYYSQARAILDFISRDWQARGEARPARVVYLYLDNPAGRDPLEVIEKESAGFGLELLSTVAVPATTVDLTTILTQIQNQNPDYIISHLAGRLPSLSLQAAEKVGFPRDRMVSFVWGISEDEIEIAQQAAEGYQGLQFTALGADNPEAFQLLDAYWQRSGQQSSPKRNAVYYARGLMAADIMLETMRLADDPARGPSLKAGAETIRDFTAHGLIPGTTITPEDHGGTRLVRMYQVQDGKLVPVQDWFEGKRPPGS